MAKIWQCNSFDLLAKVNSLNCTRFSAFGALWWLQFGQCLSGEGGVGEISIFLMCATCATMPLAISMSLSTHATYTHTHTWGTSQSTTSKAFRVESPKNGNLNNDFRE